MLKLFSCRDYQYHYYDESEHVKHAAAKYDDYQYAKGLVWDDYKGKLPESSILELPHYHPYWKHKLVVETDLYLKRERERIGLVEPKKTK